MKSFVWILVIFNLSFSLAQFDTGYQLAKADICSNTSKVVHAPPLQINIGLLDTSFIRNTGCSVELQSNGLNTKGVIYGPTLGDNVYKFRFLRFNYNASIFQNTGVKIDGIGTPLTMDIHLYNTKYGNLDAAFLKPDGLLTMRIFLLVGGLRNPLFDPVEKQLSVVKIPKTFIPFANFIDYPWYKSFLVTEDYYRYHGLHKSINGLTNYGIVLVTPIAKPKYISLDQFSVFQRLLTPTGQPLVTVVSPFEEEPKFVSHVYGEICVSPVPGHP